MKPAPKTLTEKTTKQALLALQAKLHCLQRALDEREQQLQKREIELCAREQELLARENMLDQEIEEYESAMYGDDKCESGCECTPNDAMDMCACDNCVMWRLQNPAAMRDGTNYTVATPAKPLPAGLPAGDEVLWLENLLKLKDGRK